ncbi:MAG TPA: GNAT family N-acetyltransferase [Anaerolineaceae bacterium]|nr:GNAT family N-acetyltransferase [Anaerolineaceae bacterium]
MPDWIIRLLETPEEMAAVEALQRLVWPDSETDVVPAHLLLAIAHNGGLVIGAFVAGEIVGFSFGFPGIYTTPDGPRLKHHSHMLGVHPDWRNRSLGFALKRAQWQMVRHQGVDRVTWTYDPLLSTNARLNISRLGAVCNTYLRAEYGEMRDGLNVGLPSDRFQVDWWVNTKRVERRLSRRSRPELTLDHYLTAEVLLLAAHPDSGSVPRPLEEIPPLTGSLLLVEIPPDFLGLKRADLGLARDWRFYSREVFEKAFGAGYLVTDFVHDAGRSFYVLTQGESTL